MANIFRVDKKMTYAQLLKFLESLPEKKLNQLVLLANRHTNTKPVSYFLIDTSSVNLVVEKIHSQSVGEDHPVLFIRET